MEPADFLTILGLVLAVWAIIPSKERRYLLLFFSNSELILFGVSIVLIHYLMAFDWLRDNWIPFLIHLSIPKGVPANTWAYAISLLLITYPVLKVSFGYYVRSRSSNLLALYDTYLKENELDLLVRLINKYHVTDIAKYLKAKAKLSDISPFPFLVKATDTRPYERLLQDKRIYFAALIYGHIIQDKAFVRLTANKYPEIFAQIFEGMESPKMANADLIKLYIECLFEAKNQAFTDELRRIKNSSSPIEQLNKEEPVPILASLLTHTEVADQNNVWYPVGEGAIRSLKNDTAQKQFLVKEYDSDTESQLWDCKIYLGIIYFKYMVRETIYKDSHSHMWLFYYRYFVQELLALTPENINYDSNDLYPLFTHYLINEQFSIMVGWLNLAKDREVDYRVIDTVRCLGQCIHYLCQTDLNKLTIPFRRRQLNRLLNTYFDFAFYPDNIGAATGREWLKKMFLFPEGVDDGIPTTTSEYRDTLLDAWNEFDRIPFTNYGNGALIQQFEVDVLMPLGLV